MDKFKFLEKNKLSQLPNTVGVYCFKGKQGYLYIGKAVNIRNRVKNHFLKAYSRDNLFIKQAEKVGFIKTNSEIEALILEANLIKKYQPRYNVVWRDDKNYFYVGITKDYNPPTASSHLRRAPDFPRIFITHQPSRDPASLMKPRLIGPFVDGKTLKQTLKILRRVFPYRTCRVLPKRPCLWYQLNLCPAPCLLKSNLAKEINLEPKIEKECQKNVKNLMKILQGKKMQVLKNLKKEMKIASNDRDYERAAKIRDQIGSLEKVLAHARIFEELEMAQKVNWSDTQNILQEIIKTKREISRIEAYDISNIQGEQATGSMVTFVKGLADKNFYRRFKIKIAGKPNDIAMIKEILKRRLKHHEWPYPDLILIDGGKAQLNAVKAVVKNKIKVMAIAKKKNELYVKGIRKPLLLKSLAREIFNLILQLRDEAHRFAISYHKRLRTKFLLEN